MQTRPYLNAYSEALSKYEKQYYRPGYEPTLFTSIRHSKKKYPELELFEQELMAKPIDEHKQIVKKWLTHPKLKKDNHSFRTYLLDVLMANFPNDQWDEYDNKKIIFYQPDSHTADNPLYLYRGSLQQPGEAFKKGMKSTSFSKDVEDYTAVDNENAGVSTSKSARIADLYSCQIKTDHYGVHEFYGYLYQIHYRGNEGVDIDKTQRARHVNYPVIRTKQEVNVITFIPAADIVGYGYVENGVYVQTKANPNYKPDKMAMQVKDKAELLDQVFNHENKRSSCTIL